MRYLLLALSMLLGPVTSAHAQVSVEIGVPGIHIGINLPAYPALVRVPGYPVYYDPRANANYFFYDGLYWVYQGDNWYASSWYNGPWQLVRPESVPLWVLRVPVRYYRRPPAYFRGWRADAPPRWGEHWGRDWEARHGGWDRWDRRSAPRPAPLPLYQRQYSGNRYPRTAAQQHSIRSERYRYQPREAVTQQHLQPHQQPQQPQVRAPEIKAAPHARAPGTKPAPHAESRENQAAAHAQSREHKGALHTRAPENKAAPQAESR